MSAAAASGADSDSVAAGGIGIIFRDKKNYYNKLK